MSAHPVIIVTGAAGGIGTETVRTLLKECGAKVVATDVVMGKLLTLKVEHPNDLETFIGDIVAEETSKETVEIALRKFGRLDGVCQLAGVFGPCYRLESSNVEQWTKGMQINVLSHLNMLRHALPELRKSKGRIVCATSGAGHGALFSGWGFYGMSKAAVEYEVKQLHLEEPLVTSIGISPGLCDTKMVQTLKTGEQDGQTKDDTETYRAFVKNVEMITPAVAGNAFARTVTAASYDLGGQSVDYNDSRLPIADELKAESNGSSVDYTKYT